MSAGAPKTERPVDRRALKLPQVKQLLARPVQVVRAYDIPYLAGYSQDGHIIYLDRHLPQILPVGKRLVPIGKYLQIHERTEKAILDALGTTYQAAHALATDAEHRALQAALIDPVKYEAALAPYIRSAAHESIQKVPPNLDLTPYLDEHDRTHLRALGVGT